MENVLSIKELRLNLPQILECLKKGESFTLIYRSKPIGNLVPLENKKNKSILNLIQNKSFQFKTRKQATDLVKKERK